MHDYALDPELVRLAILLGVAVSLLFYDRYSVTTGGVIVPGYLALFVIRPLQIGITLLIALLVYLMVHKLLRPRLMLWGRRLFEAEILVTLVLTTVWLVVMFRLTPFVPELGLLYGIGFLLPGIIAHDMGRQGVRATFLAAAGATFVVFALVTLIGALRDLLGLSSSFLTGSVVRVMPPYAFPPDWLFVAVIVSVLASILLYRRGLFPGTLLPDALRAGGFVTAGYLALFVTRPADLLYVLVCATATYLLVTQVFMRQAILFGRTKMAVMFMTGIVITWLAEVLLAFSRADYVPWLGFSAITPTIVALLANDAERQGPGRTLLGTALATVLVLLVTSVIYYGYQRFLGGGWPLEGVALPHLPF